MDTPETSGRADCSCKRSRCSRHGDCAACQAHHAEKGTLTFCRRSAAKQERRSLRRRRRLGE